MTANKGGKGGKGGKCGKGGKGGGTLFGKLKFVWKLHENEKCSLIFNNNQGTRRTYIYTVCVYVWNRWNMLDELAGSGSDEVIRGHCRGQSVGSIGTRCLHTIWATFLFILLKKNILYSVEYYCALVLSQLKPKPKPKA